MTGADGTWEEASNSIVCTVDGPESEAFSYVLTSALGAFHSNIRPVMCDVEYDIDVGRVSAVDGFSGGHQNDEVANRLRSLLCQKAVTSDLVADAGGVGTSWRE